MNKHQYAVIMAGGTGTRLWPMSRQAAPKQFHKLVSDKTLIQETYDRVVKVVPNDRIYVSTLEKYRDLVLEQLPQIPADRIILEPAGKNTSPAFGLIASLLIQKDPEAMIASVASDHVVSNTNEFKATFEAAFTVLAKHDKKLLAVGIKPDRPETGLGYMRMGEQIDEIDHRQVFRIAAFEEKPDEATAIKYVKSWQYLWNAAYYFWRAKDMIGWLKDTRPKVMEGIDKIVKIYGQPGSEREIKEIYSKFDNEQIEYSVVEGKDDVMVLPADLGWSDVGNWGTLHDVLSTQFDTPIIAKGHHIDYDSQNVLVYAHDKMVATVGLEDVIVVDSPDVILIANKNRAHEIKELLDKIKKEGKHLYL